MTQRTNRTEKLDLRLSRAAKQTLQAAATAAHKSVSEFVLAANAGRGRGMQDQVLGEPEHAFEVGVRFFPTNPRDSADVFVSLNDREFQRAVAVLRGVALKRVFVRPANPGHFHFDQNASASRFRHWIFPNFVLPGSYECCREYAAGRHIDDVDSLSTLRFGRADRPLSS